MDLFRFDNLAQVRGVVHGISTRSGGVSQGRCESLNVSYSVGDAPENVDENLRRISTALGSRPSDLFSAYQVHGRSVTIVESARYRAAPANCDVLATRSAKKTLMLRYADCTPSVPGLTRAAAARRRRGPRWLARQRRARRERGG